MPANARHAPHSRPAIRLRRSPQLLVGVGGGVASGKTTVAARLAAEIDAVHVRCDAVRAELHCQGLEAFSRSHEDAIYAEVLRRADRQLAAGRSVIVDGCLSRRRERGTADLEWSARLDVVTCVFRPAVVRRGAGPRTDMRT